MNSEIICALCGEKRVIPNPEGFSKYIEFFKAQVESISKDKWVIALAFPMVAYFCPKEVPEDVFKFTEKLQRVNTLPPEIAKVIGAAFEKQQQDGRGS